MEQKLMVKHSFISTLLIGITLCLLLLPFDSVKAGPPEPTSSPTTDIVTWLQPYQSPGAEPCQPDGCLLEEARLPTEAEAHPVGALGQTTFYAIADATALQGYPNLNLGDKIDMWAGYDVCLDPNGEIARALVRFDIASLPSGIDITEATLRVNLIYSCDYEDASRTITAYRITSGWSEDSVTWNNRPDYGGDYDSQSIVHGAWDWYEFDVTDLVRAWYDGTHTNHGIMLRGPEIIGWRGFSTREGPYTPQLVVEWAPPRVDSITPHRGEKDSIVHITHLAGAKFQTGATVKLTMAGEADINAENVDVVSTSKITCDLNLAGAATGAWNVVVTNPDGQSGTLSGGFTVFEPPPGAWFSAPSPTVEDLESVYMLSNNNGWAVGKDGTILHYDGSTWTLVTSPTAWDLEWVHGVSASDVWAVGEEGTILHYNGSVWSLVPSPTTSALRSIHMIAGSDGWAVGTRGKILHYDGSTWSEVTSPVNNILESIYMVSASNGWAVGSSGTVLRYDGSTWTEVTSPTDETLRAVHMLSAANGWAVGNSGTILHYDGSSWTEATSPTSSGLSSVHMTAANHGWAVGVLGKIFHYDGGTWTQVTEPRTSSYLDAVYMVSDDTGWIVGDDGLIFHYAVPPPSILAPTLRRVIPNGGTNDESVSIRLIGGNFLAGTTVKLTKGGQPDINGTSVSVYNSTSIRCDIDLTGTTPGFWDIVVTSPDSQITTLSNGFIVADPPPDNWEEFTSPVTDKDLRAVYMISTNDGWAVGENGTILHYDGSAWSAATSPADKSLYSIHCPGPGECWAVGASGTVLHYDGSDWNQVSSPTSWTLYSIHMISASDGWAVGSYGTTLHYDGSAWSPTSSTTSNTLNSVYMLSASDGWAVGSYGTILHYDGSGWSQVAGPTSHSLSTVAMVSADEGWAMGGGNRLLHYSGGTWTKLVGPLPVDWYGLYTVQMDSVNDGWAMGSSGKIIHYDGNGWVSVASPTSQYLYAMHMLASGEAWAVGRDGAILHYGEQPPPEGYSIYLPITLNSAGSH